MMYFKNILSLIALFSVVITCRGVPQPSLHKCENRTVLDFILKDFFTPETPFDNNGTNFNILAHMLKTGNNQQVLNVSISGGITFFAPNDGAIMRTMRDLGFEGSQENQTYYDIVTFLSKHFANPIGYLSKMPLYHMVAPQMTLTDIMQRSSFATFDSNLPLQRDGLILVDGNPDLPNAKLIPEMQNICTSNGYIHIIDRVLFSDSIQEQSDQIKDNLDKHSGPLLTSTQEPTVTTLATYTGDHEDNPFVSVEDENPALQTSPTSYVFDTDLTESSAPLGFQEAGLKPATRIDSWVRQNAFLHRPHVFDDELDMAVRKVQPNPSMYYATAEVLPMEIDATPATELDYSPQPSQVPSIGGVEFQASVDLEASPIASEIPRYSAIHAVPGEEVGLPAQEQDPSTHFQTSPLVENDTSIPHEQVTLVASSDLMPANNPSDSIFSQDSSPVQSLSTASSVPSSKPPKVAISEDILPSPTPIMGASARPIPFSPVISPLTLLYSLTPDESVLSSPTSSLSFEVEEMEVLGSPEAVIKESPRETLQDSAVAVDVPDVDGCFPSSAIIHLSSGQDIRMMSLEAGHRIMSSESKSSVVYLFSHRQPLGTYSFVRIVSELNHSIEMSAEHYIYANKRLKPAVDVRRGDLLRTLDGPTRVKETSIVQREGLFAPHTMHGDIVVGRVIASSYTTALPHWFAHPLLEVVRLPVRFGLMKEPLGAVLYDGFPKWRDLRKRLSVA